MTLENIKLPQTSPPPSRPCSTDPETQASRSPGQPGTSSPPSPRMQEKPNNKNIEKNPWKLLESLPSSLPPPRAADLDLPVHQHDPGVNFAEQNSALASLVARVIDDSAVKSEKIKYQY